MYTRHAVRHKHTHTDGIVVVALNMVICKNVIGPFGGVVGATNECVFVCDCVVMARARLTDGDGGHMI